jgi:predicted permease
VLVTSENYFATVGQPLLRGRGFQSSDTRETPPVAIVNQSLASRCWPGEEALGRRITFDNGTTWTTVVGIVANARQQLNSEPVDEIHLPLRARGGIIGGTVLIRTMAAPAVLSRELRESIRRVDPLQPVTRIETLDQVRDKALAPPKLVALLLGLFGLLALLITAAGIGGMLAFSVSQRSWEIGIRMALGASRGQVLWMVVHQGLKLVTIGLLLGTVGAYSLSHLMSSVLFGIPPTDLPTFAGVIFSLLVVAVLACLLPARRATAINPAVALHAN